MIKINKINWLNKDAKEAEVYLSDGNFTIACFSHPFDKKLGEEVFMPLYALNAKAIYRLTDEKMDSFIKLSSEFEYRILGQVATSHNNRIKVGVFIIELDNPLPNDIINGDYISFVCDRIDLY